MVQQQYGDTDTMTDPDSEGAARRYEEARAAAHRAMTSVTIVPDRPLPAEPVEPRNLSYRGFKFGAAFFGWLITIAMTVLLFAIASGAGAGGSWVLDYTRADAEQQAGTVAIVLAVTVGLLLALAFYIGGYVAGRLARFDGARQGFGVWIITVLLSALAIGAGAVVNSEYDLVGRVDRPDLPLASDVLATGTLATAAGIVVLTLLAALLGGKTGQRYHDKIDTLLD